MAAVAPPAATDAAGLPGDFLPSTLPRRDLERMAAYRRNLDFYRGDQWETRSRGRNSSSLRCVAGDQVTAPSTPASARLLSGDPAPGTTPPGRRASTRRGRCSGCGRERRDRWTTSEGDWRRGRRCNK
jgi:hypothetical protein